MAVLEFDGRLLIIDCGVLFPEEHQPGVDLVLPDFTHLQDRWDDIEAVILTHGHEDHIGGVPYLIQAGPDAVSGSADLIRPDAGGQPELVEILDLSESNQR